MAKKKKLSSKKGIAPKTPGSMISFSLGGFLKKIIPKATKKCRNGKKKALSMDCLVIAARGGGAMLPPQRA